MVSEEKAAQMLNATMATILGLAALAVGFYAFVTHFAAARDVYDSLPPESQRQVGGFLSSTAMMFSVALYVLSYVADRFRRWRTGRHRTAGTAP